MVSENDDFRPAAHVRAACTPDGAVLLDLRTGRYLALNTVGSAVWAELDAGGSLHDLPARLAERFEAPPEKVADDVRRFVAQLAASGLVEPGRGGASVPATRRAPGPVAGDADPAAPAAPLARAPRDTPRASAAWLVPGYLGLIAVDVALKLFGFGRVHAWLRRLPQDAGAGDVRRARELACGVDRAASFYARRAWCLQRSLATLILMRLRRWPAQLVIGVQRLPFAAHAWVELGGEVVNDDARVRTLYAVIERC